VLTVNRRRNGTAVSVTGQSEAGDAVPLVRVELGDALTDALRRAILSGAYAPGQRLVESELAERFGTSRGPVRDALAALEVRGLVRPEGRSGVHVARMGASDVDELYSLRGALESLALAWAVPRASEQDRELIRSALETLARVEIDGAGDELAAADMALHRALVVAAGHARLLTAWEALADQTMLVLRTLPTVRPDVQSASGRHRALVDAVLAGDLAVAQEVLDEHLEEARQAIRSGLDAAQTRKAPIARSTTSAIAARGGGEVSRSASTIPSV
jgi:GntR family transcriptional regulator of gluconate operon